MYKTSLLFKNSKSCFSRKTYLHGNSFNTFINIHLIISPKQQTAHKGIPNDIHHVILPWPAVFMVAADIIRHWFQVRSWMIFDETG